ncbi:MAG: tripartite tricarboxylate transporter TctB family protein [Synergistaceae bacterium]|jgi:hypothetical protein|nr:tripartite tricarboxylate transporter TctB family protein [Synergistaceae bacterium]
MKRSKLINLTMPVFFALFGLWILFTSRNMGKLEGTFPRMVGVLTFIVALFQLYFDVRLEDHKDKFRGCNLRKVIEALVAMSLYVFMLNKIGYLLDTALIAFYIMHSLGYRKYGLAVPIAVAFSLGAFFVFKILLGVPLPTILLDF